MINTVAINYSSCIKQSSNWGYDKFYNVCNSNGEWVTVPWGSMDWTAHLLGPIIFATMAAFLIGIFSMMVKAERQQQEMFDKLPF